MCIYVQHTTDIVSLTTIRVATRLHGISMVPSLTGIWKLHDMNANVKIGRILSDYSLYMYTVYILI